MKQSHRKGPGRAAKEKGSASRVTRGNTDRSGWESGPLADVDAGRLSKKSGKGKYARGYILGETVKHIRETGELLPSPGREAPGPGRGDGGSKDSDRANGLTDSQKLTRGRTRSRENDDDGGGDAFKESDAGKKDQGSVSERIPDGRNCCTNRGPSSRKAGDGDGTGFQRCKFEDQITN